MRKENGFTLIELLAVIVILAVIALIVTPVISGIIEKTKKSSYLRSFDGYMSAVQMSYSNSVLSNINMPNGRYYINNEGNLTKLTQTYNISVSGNKPISGEITLNSGKVVSGVAIMNNYIVKYFDGKSEIESIDVNKTYGLEYNIKEKKYTRLEDAVGLNACVGTNADICDNDFDSAEIYRDIVEVTDSYGNTFVKIPKFYIKKEVTDNYLRWYISSTKKDDTYYLPYCFYDFENNKELDYFLIGKYDASLSDISKLESKSNKVPSVSLYTSQYKSYASANNIEGNKGYQQMDIHMLDAIQTLFYIEEGTLDSKSIMQGYNSGVSPWQSYYVPLESVNNTNKIKMQPSQVLQFHVGQSIDISTTNAARDVAANRRISAIDEVNGIIKFEGNPINVTTSNIVSNCANMTGTTDNILTSSGSSKDNTSGKFSMSYRGIENLYGNIGQIIDGVLIGDTTSGTGTIYIEKDSSKYNIEDLSQYQEVTGYKKSAPGGFVTKMGYDSNVPYLQLPITVTDDYSSSIYKNFYYISSTDSTKILLNGGFWFVGNQAGISEYDLRYTLTTSQHYVGARLAKKDL